MMSAPMDPAGATTDVDGIVFFDFDGVLNDGSTWRAVHHALDTVEEANQNYERFLENEVNFEEWVHLDAGLWEGTPESEFRAAVDNIDLADNIDATVDALHARGFIVGIVSAGIENLIEMSVAEDRFDFIIGNTVTITSSEVTGDVSADVTAETKQEIFRQLADQHGIPLECSVFIGDSRDDLMPISKGLNIAFNPESEMAATAGDVHLEGTDVSGVITAVDAWVAGVSTDACQTT